MRDGQHGRSIDATEVKQLAPNKHFMVTKPKQNHTKPISENQRELENQRNVDKRKQ